MPTALNIYPSRSKLVRYAASSVLLAVFFGMTLQYHTQWHSATLWYEVAQVGVPVALGVLLYWLYRLAVRTPLLIVNADGITDQSSLAGVGLIRWDEIAHITLTTTQTFSDTQTTFTIIPRDPTLISHRQRFPLSMLHMWLGDGTITIGQMLQPISMPTLFAQVKEYYSTTIALHQQAIAFEVPSQPVAA